MKEFTTDKIRNVCLAGQRGCGKTSLADAVAFNAKANNRIGRVDDGSSLMDYTDFETSRGTSLFTTLLAFEWKGSKVNLLDCPGHSDFIGELMAAARVSDSIGFVINAAAGVEVGTTVQWNRLQDFPGARFFFVNKIETENVDWNNCLNSIREEFGKQAVAVHLPIGVGPEFKGVVDLLHMKAYEYDASGNRKEVDIPADLKDQAEAERENLVEVAAESDDELLEKFFDAGTLEHQDVDKGLRTGIINGTLFPILIGAAAKNFGVQVLMDFMTEYLPTADQMPPVEVYKDDNPENKVELKRDPNGPTVAFVFKTVSEGHVGEMSFFRAYSGTVKPGGDLKNQSTNATERTAQVYTMQGKNRIDIPSVPAGDIGVLVKLKDTHTGNTLSDSSFSVTVPPIEYPNPVTDVAVTPKAKGDEEKIGTGLNRLHEEDPTFKLVQDASLKQLVLWGQGPTQIDVIMEKLKQRFGTECELVRPKVPYRETVRGKSEKQYRHKKQSGGRGQFGDVHIRIEPLPRGGGFEFVDEIKGGVIPSKFIPAVEKGIVEAMQSGSLSNSPVVDTKVTLFFGSYHDVDSSDMAFKIAGLMAFREGYLEAKPTILEPIYNIEVVVPDDFTGDVMGDLSSRRGKIAGMDPEGRNQRIRAAVPQAELYQYSVDLRSMTQGQGMYSAAFSHYEEVPHDVSQKIQEQTKADREAELAAK